MKPDFRSILAIILILAAACQPVMKIETTLEAETQPPLPIISITSEYPPPLPVGTAYSIDTPFPYPISTPSPILTPTFRPSLSPTKMIFVTETPNPSPLGYPTGRPWPPPTQTPFSIPHESPTPVIFPTPAFPATPTGKPPSGLQALWYVYAAGQEVDPVLQMELLDASAQRWGKGPAVSDLKLEQKFYFSPTLGGLYPSPDGRWMAAIIAQEVSTQLFIIDPVSGKSTRILPDNAFVQFLGWKPDSQRIMVVKDDLTPWFAGEVDLVTGRYQPFEFPPMDGNHYSIEAIEYSPDGRWMADAIVYHPSVWDRKYVLSIGLWDTQTQARETLQEIPLAQGIVANSLVWSPDGNILFWISRTKTGNDWSDRDVQTELWVSDRISGETKSIGRFEGVGVKRGWVEWSPDRKKLAVVKNEEQEDGFFTGNIFLLDPFSGAETQVSKFNQIGVTHLQWSRDGRWIFCNVFDRLSGAIWAVNAASGQAFPVAGPVIPHSPFALIP